MAGFLLIIVRSYVYPLVVPVAHEETTKVFVPARSEKVSLSRYLPIYIGALEYRRGEFLDNRWESEG